MAQKNKMGWTLGLIFMVVAAVFVGKALMGSQDQLRQLNEARTKGPANAPLQIVEYFDFQCPACASGAKILKDFMDQHPTIVRVEARYFPLDMHTHAYASARYAECAARQDKFWPYHDFLMERQSAWSRLPDATPAFEQIARDVQLDMSELEQCLQLDAVDALIMKTKQEGNALRIRSTPSYVINGELVVGPRALERKLLDAVPATE